MLGAPSTTSLQCTATEPTDLGHVRLDHAAAHGVPPIGDAQLGEVKRDAQRSEIVERLADALRVEPVGHVRHRLPRLARRRQFPVQHSSEG